VPGYDNPNNASHFLNGTTRFRLRNGKYGGMYQTTYDIHNGGFLQQRLQGHYASQCCGFAVDYQMMNISQFGFEGVQRDRRITVTFSLAGIGSFITPLGAFGR
jgi:hypothetical protein